MIGFVIWTLVAIIFVVIGIYSWNSKKAVGFFSCTKEPKIQNDKRIAYNHSVAIIWFVYSAVLEILGIPLLLFKQNSSYFIISILGVVFLSIAIAIVYLKVESYFRK